MQRVVVRAGKEVAATVSYLPPSPRAAPVPGTAPVITAVTVGTAPPSPYVWIAVLFTDPECDVVGGTWIGAGEAIGDFGRWGRTDLMRNLTWGGVGSLEFARTCTELQSVERLLVAGCHRPPQRRDRLHASM